MVTKAFIILVLFHLYFRHFGTFAILVLLLFWHFRQIDFRHLGTFVKWIFVIRIFDIYILNPNYALTIYMYI